MSPSTRRRLLFLAAGAAVLMGGVYGYLWLNRPVPLRVGRELIDALTLKTAAELYRAQHTGCPSLDQVHLWTDTFAKLRTHDSWGTRFRMRCATDGTVLVTSAGPDRRFGSADDLDTDDEGRWPRP